MLRKYIAIFSFLYKGSYSYVQKYFLLSSRTCLCISKFDRDGANYFIGYMFIKFMVRVIFRTRDSTNHYLKSYLLTLSNGIHPLIRPFRSFWIALCYLVPLILSLSFDTGGLSPLSYLCDFRAHVRRHNPNTNWIIIPPGSPIHFKVLSVKTIALKHFKFLPIMFRLLYYNLEYVKSYPSYLPMKLLSTVH